VHTYIFTHVIKTEYLTGMELMRRKKGMLREEKRRLHMHLLLSHNECVIIAQWVTVGI
jgi:hypothetical protein